MPMPALAPGDRPGFGSVEEGDFVGRRAPALVMAGPVWVSIGLPPAVGRVVVERPPLSTQRRVVPRAVHVWPEVQQPPPSEAGQLNWLLVQPVGEGLTVFTVAVLIVDEQELPERQTECTEQQPPPTDSGHWWAEGAGQPRSQHWKWAG
jgi:hypothetical protein